MNRGRHVTYLAGVALFTSGIIGLGGCGHATGPRGDQRTRAATSPALPTDFPRPPSSVLLKEHHDRHRDAYLLAVGSRGSAVRYWRQALPQHGWRILADHHVKGFAQLQFTGHGYGGVTRINFFGRRAAVIFQERR